MILYNVNFHNDTDNILVPSTPYSAAIGEDREIKRICLSDSIEGCITAISPSERPLVEGARLIVKKVALEESKLLYTPEHLYSTGLVPDALENREYWYLDKLNVTVLKAIVVSFEYYMDLAWTCIKPEEVKAIAESLGLREMQVGTSKEIYDAACCYFNSNKLWDKLDAMYDNTAELPWAQRIVINNLKLKYVNEF